GVWVPTGNNLLIISVYAPRELAGKKMLWDYLTHVMTNWKGDVVMIGDVNEVCKKDERFGSVYSVQGPDAFNLFISNAGSEENPLEKIRVRNKAKKEISKNSKICLKAELAELDSVPERRGEFLSHFKKRFEQPQAFRLQIDTNFPNKLTLGQQVDLENDVSKDEIKRAVWDYGMDKSLVRKMDKDGKQEVDVNKIGGKRVCDRDESIVGKEMNGNEDFVDDLNGEIKDCLDQDIGDNCKRNVECEKSANKSDDSASKSVYQDKVDKIAEKESNANIGSNRGVWNMKLPDIMNANKIDNKLMEISTEISENGNEVVTYSEARYNLRRMWNKFGYIDLMMNDGGEGMINFARVLIEIEAGKGLKKEIEVVYKGNINHEKFTKIIKVEYVWKPPCCDKCKVFRHDNKSCMVKEREVQGTVNEQNMNNSMNFADRPFTVVKNRKVIYEKEKQNKSYNKWNGYNGVYIYKRCYGTQSRKIVNNYMNKENEGVNIDKQGWSNETKRYYKDKKKLFDAAKEMEIEEDVEDGIQEKEEFGLRDECMPETHMLKEGNYRGRWELRSISLKGILSDEAQRMCRGVCEVEIKNAMFDIDDSKTPGPDGFTARFYKSAWSIIGKDVCKMQNPNKVFDFRPIACCNVPYKCISKICTNRIKGVLGKLVNESQSAFIAGRQITENILLAQELFKGYNTKQKFKRVIFKTDLQKAYDTVDWSFLKVILEQFGFPGKMVDWIMVCVSTTKFSININGGRKGYFSRGKGLRQGDHMSPYLFTPVMEFFSIIMGRNIGKIKELKYHHGCKKLQITHLCFDNDLLVFCHGILSMTIAEQNVSLDIIPFAIGRLPVRAN
nr:hypothetical protein [Tanacetum cinerariifolium]